MNSKILEELKGYLTWRLLKILKTSTTIWWHHWPKAVSAHPSLESQVTKVVSFLCDFNLWSNSSHTYDSFDIMLGEGLMQDVWEENKKEHKIQPLTLRRLQFVEARSDYNNDSGFMGGLWKLGIWGGHN